MALMVFIQNLHVLNCRSESKSFFKVPLKNNIMVIFSIGISILLQIIVMESETLSELLNTHSVPYLDLLKLLLLAIPILIIMDLFKFIRNKKKCQE